VAAAAHDAWHCSAADHSAGTAAGLLLALLLALLLGHWWRCSVGFALCFLHMHAAWVLVAARGSPAASHRPWLVSAAAQKLLFLHAYLRRILLTVIPGKSGVLWPSFAGPLSPAWANNCTKSLIVSSMASKERFCTSLSCAYVLYQFSALVVVCSGRQRQNCGRCRGEKVPQLLVT
jgi:hypothetical protein